VCGGRCERTKTHSICFVSTIREDGTEVRIDIYRLETTDWSLEVVDETGTSTVWDDLFPTDQAALDEALKTIREEGIGTFLSGKTDIMH
jgi:hypothetical protein